MSIHTRSFTGAARCGLRLLALAAATAMLGACATPPAWDYSAYKQSRPATLLVLPPVNETPDVKATYGVLSQVTLPLSEAGYYVVPVSLMDETFRQNGLTSRTDIHAVPAQRLRDIFGADAAVLIKVTQYGTEYAVIASATTVTAKAQVVDLKSGAVLCRARRTIRKTRRTLPSSRPTRPAAAAAPPRRWPPRHGTRPCRPAR